MQGANEWGQRLERIPDTRRCRNQNQIVEEGPAQILPNGTDRNIADAEGTWDQIRARRAVDVRFDAMVSRLESDAAAVLEAEPVTYKKTGRRLLSVSRKSLRLIMLLAVVYNVNGEEVYLRRAEDEMRAVMAFEDWNPSHFLDVGEMAAAVAVGYDWLYDGLDPGFRDEVRAVLWDKADASTAEVQSVVLLRGPAIVNINDLVFTGTPTDPEITAAHTDLAAVGILTR